MVIFMILDRIAFCILLSKSTALSSSVKESEEDPTVPRVIIIIIIIIIQLFTVGRGT